jgi:hypothetical protein
MKKCIAISLCSVLMIALCACSSTSQTAASTNSDQQTAGNIAYSQQSSSQTSAGGEEQKDISYVMENEVVVDNEYCTFTITKVEDDPVWGVTLKVLCENKSDKNLTFSWEDVSVDGYMIDPLWATSVAAGKKDNSSITFSSSEFTEIGITSVDQIKFELRVYDSDDWTADEIVEEVFTVYPTGLAADDIIIPERPAASGEYVVYDSDDCTFIILGQEQDSIWGYGLKYYIENKTDKGLTFSWDNVSVNGFMIDPFWATSVAAGSREVSEISFFSSSLEENDISEVSEIEFALRVYDSDNFFSDDIVNQVFTYVP